MRKINLEDRKMKKISLFIMLFTLPFVSIASENVNDCMTRIETQSQLPEGTFKAMMKVETGSSSVEKASEINKKRDLYGPVGISEKAVNMIAQKTGISAEEIKNDTCTNLKAVAFLMDKKGVDKPLSVKLSNYHGKNIPVYTKKVQHLLETSK